MMRRLLALGLLGPVVFGCGSNREATTAVTPVEGASDERCASEALSVRVR
jgi:hypothetical protein